MQLFGDHAPLLLCLSGRKTSVASDGGVEEVPGGMVLLFAGLAKVGYWDVLPSPARVWT